MDDPNGTLLVGEALKAPNDVDLDDDFAQDDLDRLRHAIFSAVESPRQALTSMLAVS